jgi:hypothetical protein
MKEIQPQEAQSDFARQWLREHYGTLADTLQIFYDLWVKRISESQFLLESFGLPHDDPHSGPFCRYVYLLPTDIREQVSIASGEVVYDSDTDEQRSIDHTVIHFGDVIVDATFGQFVDDLDPLIAQFPQLFEGRIFIGTAQEANQISGAMFLF